MNETAIQNELWAHLRDKQHELVVPNYTPKQWWECDVFSLTKAGMMVEHEIKLTVGDFKADAKKERERKESTGPAWHEYKMVQEKKHDRLALADPHGPTRFFYVVPNELLKPEDVPVWAGLIYFRSPRRTFETVKKAPKLHTQPVPEAVSKHALGVLYWRYWHLRTALKCDDPRLASEPREGEG